MNYSSAATQGSRACRVRDGQRAGVGRVYGDAVLHARGDGVLEQRQGPDLSALQLRKSGPNHSTESRGNCMNIDPPCRPCAHEQAKERAMIKPTRSTRKSTGVVAKRGEVAWCSRGVFSGQEGRGHDVPARASQTPREPPEPGTHEGVPERVDEPVLVAHRQHRARRTLVGLSCQDVTAHAVNQTNLHLDANSEGARTQRNPAGSGPPTQAFLLNCTPHGGYTPCR
jgi:hypothetical protein